MALVSFLIENQKVIGLAKADNVPRVMVIAGPNGAGKSTLLYAIKQQVGNTLSGPTRILYQGPHRVLRRTNVRRSWLGGGLRWFIDLLVGGDISGFEGLQTTARTPDNVDEAGSTIKHTLGKIENRRQAVLAELIDAQRGGAPLDVSQIPDVYEPLRLLTKYLLPHLVFSRVDFTNEDNIRVLWSRAVTSGSLELDIDDLSSGEKSVIVLFLPLLEDDIRNRLETLGAMRTGGVAEVLSQEDRVVLIDEPEQHLHPDLQAKILGYIRNLARGSRTQFILATHSPTILDQALDDELFLLTPPSGEPAENQLKRIATSLERLEALKQLAGSTYFLTTGRSIVCIEGEVDPAGAPSDARLLEILYPRATAFTLIPTGGKGNVITTVQRLREHLPEIAFGIRIYGLVDRDQASGSISGIVALPVCMIENLLLDPEVLCEYLSSIGISTFSTFVEVARTLDEICANLRDDEIRLRIAKKLGSRTIRLGGSSVQDIKGSRDRELSELQRLLPSDEKLAEELQLVAREVDRILAAGEATRAFRGKAILREFFNRLVASRNIAYADFCYEVARRVGTKSGAAGILDPVFDQLSGP